VTGPHPNPAVGTESHSKPQISSKSRGAGSSRGPVPQRHRRRSRGQADPVGRPGGQPRRAVPAPLSEARESYHFEPPGLGLESLTRRDCPCRTRVGRRSRRPSCWEQPLHHAVLARAPTAASSAKDGSARRRVSATELQKLRLPGNHECGGSPVRRAGDAAYRASGYRPRWGKLHHSRRGEGSGKS